MTLLNIQNNSSTLLVARLSNDFYIISQENFTNPLLQVIPLMIIEHSFILRVMLMTIT